MLEDIRNNSGSLIVWILFAIIIAAFVLFFGPQAGEDMFGCGQSQSFPLKINKSEVKASSWRFAMNGLPFVSNIGRQRTQRLPASFDALIERELLANAASEKGFRISDELVDKRIASGELLVMGYRLPWSKNETTEKIVPAYFSKDGAFDYDTLQSIAGQSFGGLSVDRLREEQKKELLADAMRQFLTSNSTVSDEEIRAQYILANTRVSAEYVKFDVSKAKNALVLDDVMLAAYQEKHLDQIKASWEEEKAQWAEAKDRVSAQIIKVNKTPNAPDGADDANKDKKEEAATLIARAKKRLDKGESFAKIASEISDDERTRFRGGTIGWRSTETLGYGKDVSEAVKTIEAGTLSDVVETDSALFLVKILKRSKEALSFEDFKNQLTDKAAREFYATHVAQKAAQDALAQAQTKPLDELFEKSMPTGLPEGFDPSMFLKQNGQGAVYSESENIYVQSEQHLRMKKPTPQSHLKRQSTSVHSLPPR